MKSFKLMEKIIKILIPAMILILTISFGCTKDIADIDEVRKYSDTMAENLLVGLSDGDYGKFSKDFDDEMKGAIPEESFGEFGSQIKEGLGEYVTDSKEYLNVTREDEFTIVYYKAEYINDSTKRVVDTKVKVVFRKVNGEMKIVGLWYE
ncbi:MAG: DUF3887 domain-containing protein [Actinobacteria bacterium]|nr:DUF3887 domain-containing protein [Actinomycetota bacterium]MBL7060352.1 DUF3887 domain-containing protein [Actinomycetota bacterium]